MGYSKTEKGRITTAGGDVLLILDVSPDAATGNITISDVDYAYVVGVVPLIEDHDGSNDHILVQALENSSTKNQIDIKLWKSPNSAASTYKDFRLTLLLKDAAI